MSRRKTFCGTFPGRINILGLGIDAVLSAGKVIPINPMMDPLLLPLVMLCDSIAPIAIF